MARDQLDAALLQLERMQKQLGALCSYEPLVHMDVLTRLQAAYAPQAKNKPIS